MADAPVPRQPDPAPVIVGRLEAHDTILSPNHTVRLQAAYAIIGALEQAGWVIVRKRHQRK